MTTDERMRILGMISEGKISAEEGARLMGAMTKPAPGPAGPPGPPNGATTGRWLRLRVSDAATGHVQVNINVPVGLVGWGLRLGSRFSPELVGLDDELHAALADPSVGGRIMEVQDEDGQRVEIFVE